MTTQAPLRLAEIDERVRSALSSDRPRRPSALAVSLTFAWRTLLKMRHVPEQLFDVTAFPIMFTLMFTYLFGGAIAGPTRAYLQFLLPGIVVQTVVFITMYSAAGLNTDISNGIFDRFRSMPIWRPAPLVGSFLGDAVRYSMASLIVIVVGLILGFRPGGGALGVVAAVGLLLVFAFSLGWIWALFGLIMRTPNGVMMSSMMVLFPLTFASSIFVDPRTMPWWLQRFVNVNPITLMATAECGLMAGTATVGQVVVVLAVSAAIVAIFAPITMYRYRNLR